MAVVGGGWAGLSAAVRAVQQGHQVTLLEATRHWGGRARTLPPCPAERQPTDPHAPMAPVAPLRLDNGQHILIGAYTGTLRLLQDVGVDLSRTLQRLPLALRFPDGTGLSTPPWAQRWPAPLALLAHVLTAPGWRWRDQLALLRMGAHWRAQGFTCAPELTVATLCAQLPERVLLDLIEPLCVAALNTPMPQADGRVFLRVLQDALLGPGYGPYRASDLLLPQTDLGALLPQAAVQWLQKNGAMLESGARLTALTATTHGRWELEWSGQHMPFDRVVLACAAQASARLLRTGTGPADPEAQRWARCAEQLAHTAIATVYLQTEPPWRWPSDTAMLALRTGQAGGPAQFVFNRGRMGGPPGLLAFVASACQGSAAELEQQVLQQARQELGLTPVRVLKTVVEKHATFACLPGVQRPGARIAPGLWAAGDFVDGPYPATLEGAVRSGEHAAAQLTAG